LGWVGTAIGKSLIELGNEVILYDMLDKNLPNFTKDIDYAVANSNISFICVPTPTSDKGAIDLSYIKEASKNIGRVLASQQKYHLVVVKSTVVPRTTENIVMKYHLVVVKSTVVPRTTENIVIPLLEKYSGKKAGENFGVGMNPEFLTEISGTWSSDKDYNKDFFTEDRIVIGEYDERSGNVLEGICSTLNKSIFRTDLRTAEMIKYASNCMLATKISYWNEIFLICEKLGINSQAIANVVALDPRIGKYGSVHGKAFGGKCLPKDLKAFVSFAKEYKEPKLLRAVDEINEEMKKKYGERE
jgi:UDPglucose 6-dehydrogenase